MIGIVGGGIGGLSAAVALGQAGHDVVVYEQAQRYGRVGADINLTPNVVRALDGLGVGDALRETAARPTHRISRMWDTGEETSRLPMADGAEQRYGAPQLTMHRADLIAALQAGVDQSRVHFGAQVTAIDVETSTLQLAGADEQRVDVLIGADGIHSTVRAALLGPDQPVFTGVVAYRAVIPRNRVDVPNLDAFTKWWGPNPDTQLVCFPLSRGEEIFIFATTPQDSWRDESWTMPGSVEELRETYRGFHPEATALLAACDSVLKSALYVRDPLPTWTRGSVALLGDACHPMMPFMAQGAGQAIEDAVVLARQLTHHDDVAIALKAYQATRLERTSRIQIASRGNEWLKAGGDPGWVYGYDAWTVPLS